MITETVPGINPYHYCYDNPIRYRDLFGLDGQDPNTDMWGRKKYDENGMYIPPPDRPSLSNYGNTMYGHYEDRFTGSFSASYYASGWYNKDGSFHKEKEIYSDLEPIYKAVWIWDTDLESEPLSSERINEIASAVGVVSAQVSLSIEKAMTRTYAYTSTRSLLKPSEVMFKLPRGSLHLRVSTVKGMLNATNHLGTLAGVYSTGYSYYQIYTNNGRSTVIDYSDAAMGTLGLASGAGAILTGSELIPGVNFFVGCYFAGRAGWDFGWSMAPKYGPINGYYWSWNQ